MSFHEKFSRDKYRYLGHLMVSLAFVALIFLFLLFAVLINSDVLQQTAKLLNVSVTAFGSMIACLIFIQVFLIVAALYSANFLYKKEIAKRWVLSTIVLLLLTGSVFFMLAILSSTLLLVPLWGALLYCVLGSAVFLLFAKAKKLEMKLP